MTFLQDVGIHKETKNQKNFDIADPFCKLQSKIPKKLILEMQLLGMLTL